MSLSGFRCQQCAGKGRRIARVCPRCKGGKVLDTQHTLAVHIPAGAPEGFEEVFHGEADESTDWEAGDVVVRVRSQRLESNGVWGRKENGIIGRVTLSVAEVSGDCRPEMYCDSSVAGTARIRATAKALGWTDNQSEPKRHNSAG